MPAAAGIFRQLTPPGEGGIAVFAVEGPGARAALRSAVRSARLAALRPGELAYGRLTAADGATLDEVIVACLPLSPAHRPSAIGLRAERSEAQGCRAVARQREGGPDQNRASARHVCHLPFPQVERFELSCHAGGAAAAATAARLAELGLVPGEPAGEAGSNILDRDFRAALPACRTRRQLEALAAARAALPAALDRVRSALGPPADLARAERLFLELREESRRLGALLSAHRAALAGPANAGKSTLFNRLAGLDLAIASPHPGTTRDTVETALSVRGLAVELADTAGLGPAAPGELARRAQLQGRERAAGAELLLLVLDAARAPGPEQAAAMSEMARGAGRTLLALNKCDLDPAGKAGTPATLAGRSGRPALRVSALTGQGLPELLAAIEAELLPDAPRGRAAAVPGGEVAALLEQAYTCVRRAAMNNGPAAAAEAAALLEAGLEAEV